MHISAMKDMNYPEMSFIFVKCDLNAHLSSEHRHNIANAQKGSTASDENTLIK